MYVKRDNFVTDLNTYIQSKTTKTIEELQDSDNHDYEAPALIQVAALINAQPADQPIVVVGDFDCDGLMALAEFATLLRALQKKFFLIVPKRFSEGYGFSEKILERIPDNSLVITVDNGITAVDTIAAARTRGMRVIIMDHHKNDGDLPNANLILDPIVDQTGFEFKHYCGAGLTYKLSQIMLKDKPYVLNQILCYAAIATVADVVQLTQDNRNIVRKGITLINNQMSSPGLNYLIGLLVGEAIEASDIAFKIAPAINAPGRLVDNGGELVLRCVLALHDYEVHATAIKNYNNQRQRLTKEAVEAATVVGTNLCYSRVPGLCEGLCGIVANKIAQTNKKPTLVTTLTDDGETIKGSARSYAEESVHDILQSAENLFEAFGGHEKAAGLAFKLQNEDAILRTIDAAAAGIAHIDANTDFYDFEVAYADVFNMYQQLDTLKPFGVGLENPLIKITIPVDRADFIGSDHNTLRFPNQRMTFIGFSMGETYVNLGRPNQVTLYGHYASNHYKGRVTPQFVFEALEV